MLNFRSLRFRLAAWYFGTVVVISLAAAAGYWYTIQHALDHALDQGLRYRLIGLHRFIEEVHAGGEPELARRLAETSQLGELYQVFNADGALISQSEALKRHGVPEHPPADLDFAIRYTTGGTADFQLRHAWQQVRVGGQLLILGVADPQRKYEGVERAFSSVLTISIPLILGLATVCGLWLGRRALAPVSRITEDARAISESNLSARLAVPDSNDEVQQLSETLNEMLNRIELSFTRTRQFTADASHELRAPMTLIYTAAQHCLRRERSREELVESMRKILRESQRTTALINDMLTLARGDSGRESAGLGVVDAAVLLREAAEEATPMGAAQGLQVQLRAPDGPLPVCADEAKLRRLLLILVDNAIKYTAAGEVTLEGRREGLSVALSVADTGAGIAGEDLPHIFERFWRADKVRSREAGGTGLGLAIARQIAEQHGATLTVESELGHGSVFTLRMPLAAG